MKKIVAIGGGEIGREGFRIETESIDREIINLSGRSSPKVLFIPTASKDADKYVSVFERYYGDKLGCKVETLYLNDNSDPKTIRLKILSTDIVYVGGGNTLRLMTVWRKLGVDRYLKEAWEKGIVMSGLSAGAICWFDFGHSDSRKSASKNASWNLIKVKGLGFYHFIFCPHYHFEKREEDFKKLIARDGGIGLAFDNKTALEIIDDKFRIIKSDTSAKAYRISLKGVKTTVEELEQAEYAPLSALD